MEFPQILWKFQADRDKTKESERVYVLKVASLRPAPILNTAAIFT